MMRIRELGLWVSIFNLEGALQIFVSIWNGDTWPSLLLVTSPSYVYKFPDRGEKYCLTKKKMVRGRRLNLLVT